MAENLIGLMIGNWINPYN